MSNKTVWKRLAIAASAAALVGTVVAATLPSSEALISRPRVVCKGDKSHLLEQLGGGVYTVNTRGFLAADISNGFLTADGRQGTNLIVADVFSTGAVDALGTVTFALDASRSAGGSAIVANQKDAAFPATQTMRFHFTTTIDGKSYRSQTPAVVVNSAVGSFPPAEGTTYVLTNAVTLEDAAKPGVAVFRLQPGKAFTVTSTTAG